MSRNMLLSYLLRAAGTGEADAELLSRFAATRDGSAFELIVRRHADMVWKVCRGIAPQHASRRGRPAAGPVPAPHHSL